MPTEVENNLSSFVSQKEIAEGANTQLILASAKHLLDKKVVLKQLKPEYLHDPELVKSLELEAKILLNLSHPNVIEIYDYICSHSQQTLVLEYIEGWTLREIIKRHNEVEKKIPEWFILWFIVELYRTLECVHHSKNDKNEPLEITHHDINPKNLIVTREGNFKLIDFSIAQSRYGKAGQFPHIGKGSISYMAPEQILGKDMDLRTDLFSSGIVLFEMLFGKKPFEGTNQFEIRKRILHIEVTTNNTFRKLDEIIQEVVLKSLNKDPLKRYQSAAEMESELAPYFHLKYPGLISWDIAKYLENLFNK